MTDQTMTTNRVVQPRPELSPGQRREQARRMYRESLAAELPMTAEALGRTFGRSLRWGRDRLAEVRAEQARRIIPERELSGMPQPEQAVNDAQRGMPSEPRQAPSAPAGMPHDPQSDGTAEPGMPVRRVRPWPVLLLALPAFVAIWGGWVGLGEMTGFGEINMLPGIVPAGGWATIDSAITLPIGVETYAAFALRAWLTGAPVPPRARRFAKWSAIGSLVLGCGGQVAYHQMIAAGITVAPWWITTLVSCLPVAVLGMGVALAHLLQTGGASR